MADPSPRACSIAAALTVLGEKWSLLVVRELALNVHRFDQIARNTGAPRDILTSRLRRLEAEGILEKRCYQEHPPRYEYHLTESGAELRSIVLALKEWGDTHLNRGREPVIFAHVCGADAANVSESPLMMRSGTPS